MDEFEREENFIIEQMAKMPSKRKTKQINCKDPFDVDDSELSVEEQERLDEEIREMIERYETTKDEPESEDFIEFKSQHDDMLKAYRAQNWDEALDLSRRCKNKRLDLTGLYKLYAERMDTFKATPPPAGALA